MYQTEPLEHTISVEGRSIPVDQLGYLLDPSDWSAFQGDPHCVQMRERVARNDQWLMKRNRDPLYRHRHGHDCTASTIGPTPVATESTELLPEPEIITTIRFILTLCE